jgi:hypothetical protein
MPGMVGLAAGFVVDDHERVVWKTIDAIDAAAQIQAG